MRFVIIQGIVLNTEAIDSIAPKDHQSEVSLRGGHTLLFDLTAEDLLEHLRHESDDVLRVAHDPKLPA